MKHFFIFLVLFCLMVNFSSCSKEEDLTLNSNDDFDSILRSVGSDILTSDLNFKYDGEVRIVTKQYFHGEFLSNGSTDYIASFKRSYNIENQGDIKVSEKSMVWSPNSQIFQLNGPIFFSDDIPNSKYESIVYKPTNSSGTFNEFEKDILIDRDLRVTSSNWVYNYDKRVYVVDRNKDVDLKWNACLKSNGVFTIVKICPLNGDECKIYDVSNLNAFSIPKGDLSNYPNEVKLNINVVRGYQDCLENSGKKICFNVIAYSTSVNTILN